LEPLGERDGRIGLYLADKLTTLLPPVRGQVAEPLNPREAAIVAELQRSGALFFAQLHDAVGGGYPGETLDALWNLVWRGVVSNDTLHALRAYAAKPTTSRPAKRQHNVQAFRSRRTTPPSAQGRWALLPASTVTPTEWSHAIAQQLLSRHGIVSRETITQENIPGGFSAIYDVLKALEESGRIRRGYFVAGLGATQFALPSAVDLLRSLRSSPQPERAEILSLAATDPANPYGAVLPWPTVQLEYEADGATRSLMRSVGATVVLRNGELIAYVRRNNPNILVFLPPDDPERTNVARDLSAFLSHMAQDEMQQEGEARHRGGLLIATINGQPAHLHPLSRFLQDAGFQAAPLGFNVRRILPPIQSASAEVQ
jgi:ATP-dependent Lhr-like helicase